MKVAAVAEAAALEAPKALTDKSNWRSGLRVRLLVDRKADKMFQRSEDAAERAKTGDAGGVCVTAGAGGQGLACACVSAWGACVGMRMPSMPRVPLLARMRIPPGLLRFMSCARRVRA